MEALTKTEQIVSWIAQLVIAGIFIQTLYFKFTGAPESVHIFEALGAEPWGRWATGLGELTAALLLLIPGTAVYGALLAAALMAGALFSHFTNLGIEVQGDGGLLFTMACISLVSALVVLYLRRRQLPFLA